MKLVAEIVQWQKELTAWRRDIHAHPELAFDENRTSDFVAQQLESCGISVTRGIGKIGVVGTLTAGTSSRSIGLRADMDALPMDELNNFSHKSTYPGKMHGCGHDGHTVILLAAARYLASTQNFDGTVQFVFQPAEEANAEGSGAKAMIDDGLFDRFPMDSIFGLHNAPGLKVGGLVTRVGPLMASMDLFEVIITGQGTHGAVPHTGIDPLLVVAQLILAWQSIVSRNVNSLDSAVISATSVAAGDSWNVIPDSVVVRGSVRTLSETARQLIRERFYEISENIAGAYGANITIDYRAATPVTANDEEQVKILCKAATEVVGSENILNDVPPTMGSEDFSYYLKEKPGCYFFIGNSSAESEGHKGRSDLQEKTIDFGLKHLAIHGACMTHDPNYDFNDEIIPIGASIFVKLVENKLERLG